MNTPAKTITKLNWKVAAAVGTVAGVGLGGFVFAGDDTGGLTPGQVELQDAPNSAPRLSAPVVIAPTSTSLASAASVNLSPRSPAPTTTVPQAQSVTPPVADTMSMGGAVSVMSAASPASPVSAQSAVSVAGAASPASPVSALSAVSIAGQASPASPVSAQTPVSVASPGSPASPAGAASPGSGASS